MPWFGAAGAAWAERSPSSPGCGKLHVEVDVLPLKQFGERLDNAASRLALAIVTAALIIGSAIVMTVERESALGRFGFIAAALGGLWVLFSIWRGGGRN